jgi:hypothetical protein
MVKRVAVLAVKMLVLLHIRCKAGYHQVLPGMPAADAVYIVHRYLRFCHRTVVFNDTKVQKASTQAGDETGILWYFLLISGFLQGGRKDANELSL